MKVEIVTKVTFSTFVLSIDANSISTTHIFHDGGQYLALLNAGVVLVDIAAGIWAVEDVIGNARFRFSPDARVKLDDIADPAVDQAVRQGILDVLDEAAEGGSWYRTIKTSPAEEVNNWWRTEMNYANPPYKPGTMVSEIELTQNTTFVRVYDGNTSKQAGSWMMEAETIKGLTPAQIQDKFALPTIPVFVTDVKLPAGTRLRTGIANQLDAWGTGGGIQFDLMGQKIGEFLNPRPLQE